MELKKYQQDVLDDLGLYMDCVAEKKDLNKGWEEYWNLHDVPVGLNGQQPYVNNIKGVPHVCVKSGTGSGKTLMAVSAIKTIFDHMDNKLIKLVVWLVPSDSILEQTISNLSNPDHPYRQRLNRDFGGKVEVYTKDQLLAGQNFSPDTVLEQLTVCVMSFASLRIDSTKKDTRKAFQENGNLKRFADYFGDNELLLADTPDTALMNVIRNMFPVAVVDESHNASSNLSIEMLNNINPSFVLDLTATPRRDSNIFHYVDARDVKRENMVKLPVVVYKRASRQSVMEDAIQLRGALARAAEMERREGGAYIRPIVLFQAQPKINEDSASFEHIRDSLTRMGIRPEEIAVKTSKYNELKGKDLLSEDCEINYIITVNALKEGWDCPFAYILASLANKTSKVDVEQIVGRILRQPYAHKNKRQLLNTSYVLTSSDDFQTTLNSVVDGLNAAGFSSQDYRVGLESETGIANHVPIRPTQISITEIEPEIDDFSDVNAEEVKQNIEKMQASGQTSTTIQQMVDDAEKQVTAYEKTIVETPAEGLFSSELEPIIHKNHIRDQFKELVKGIKIPQFYIETGENIFGTEEDLVSPINLSDGFTLANQDARVNFTLSTGDLYKVDITDDDAAPRYMRMNKKEAKFVQDALSRIESSEGRIRQCARIITDYINKKPQYSFNDIRDYVKRVITGMTDDELTAMEASANVYAQKIQDKIDVLEEKYRKDQFYELLSTDEITCKPGWSFPEVITPISTTNRIAKSLYTAEDVNMNGFEKEVINAISGLDNVVWWHRNIDRKGFCINGFINHYPDFIVMTDLGRIIMVETKGDYLYNENSADKISLGAKWESKSGSSKYRYFMVFENKSNIADGAYSFDDFIGMLQKL